MMQRLFSARRALLVLALSWQFGTSLAAAQSPSDESPAASRVFDTQALRALAEQGDKRAAFLLASRYASGRGVPRDDSEAVRWFSAAAEGGLAEAQYNLGIMYATGRGVPLDPAKGVHWYERAAEQGLAEAQFNLGTLYGTGRGIRRDEALAVKWLTRAAEHGLARAQYSLGALYEHGRGVRVNVHTALEWYRKAAEQGLDEAKFRGAALAHKMQLKPQQSAGQEFAPATTAPLAAPIAASKPAAKTAPPVQSATPANTPDSPTALDWVRSAPANQFTLQLGSFASRVDAQGFARGLGAEMPVGIYETSTAGESRFSVIRGTFASRAAAVAAVAKLPEKLRKLKPWVRSIAEVQKQLR